VALIWILNPAVLQAILAVPAKNERVQKLRAGKSKRLSCFCSSSQRELAKNTATLGASQEIS
jgi:hypothetical protein